MKTPLPLCVDLDGTLVKHDTQWLAFCDFWSKRQMMDTAETVFDYLVRPRASAVSRLGKRQAIDPKHLPFNTPFVQDLRAFRNKGVRLFLATGASEAIAHTVANHLGLFEKVFSSTPNVHLVGQAKSEALVAAFGREGFAYAGNSFTDIAVWKNAGSVIVVNPDAGLLETLPTLGLVPDFVYE